jgi:uncharacterized protein with FMN-binding domain
MTIYAQKTRRRTNKMVEMVPDQFVKARSEDYNTNQRSHTHECTVTE